jgi:isoamylase
MVFTLDGSSGRLGAVFWPEGSGLAQYFGSEGTNFSLYSPDAQGVTLCLYDTQDRETRHELERDSTGTGLWSLFLPGVLPGQKYLFRVRGEINPRVGLRFNPAKALLDPFARGVTGEIPHCEEIYGYRWGHHDRDLSFSDLDSAHVMPKCVVMRDRPSVSWRRPSVPVEAMVVYEAHVVSATKEFPGIPEEIRGTYAALGHPVFVQYLKELGVTSLELMPVNYFAQPGHLLDRGLKDFWGYNPLLFFTPHGYGSTQDPEALIDEIRTSFQALAEAGIEVLLDVVYNHTFEGNQLGPTVCHRGIANGQYFLLESGGRYYRNWAGTGNVLNLNDPYVQRLMVDSLLYWVEVMGVSGYRFDLAAALTRAPDGRIDMRFIDSLRHYPGLREVKLIMEPWDASGAYLVGQFDGYHEWNGPFRDVTREVVKGGSLCKLVDFFGGSRQIYGGRGPGASINFITCHDGFTLTDLVSFNNKHNDENGEGNRDGNNDTRSWNCGYEGETDDESVKALRNRQRRNFLVVLLLSQGIPMIRSGDEVGQTYNGNNNAYCQEYLNIIRWQELLEKPENAALQRFVADLTRFRREHPVFRNPSFSRGDGDRVWFGNLAPGYTIGGVYLNGEKVRNPKGQGDDSFIIFFNFHYHDYDCTIPSELAGGVCLEDQSWQTVINTADESLNSDGCTYRTGQPVRLTARSIQVLQRLA